MPTLNSPPPRSIVLSQNRYSETSRFVGADKSEKETRDIVDERFVWN